MLLEDAVSSELPPKVKKLFNSTGEGQEHATAPMNCWTREWSYADMANTRRREESKQGNQAAMREAERKVKGYNPRTTSGDKVMIDPKILYSRLRQHASLADL